MQFLETIPIVIDAESPNSKFYEYEHKDAFPNTLFQWDATDHFIATCDLIT